MISNSFDTLDRLKEKFQKRSTNHFEVALKFTMIPDFMENFKKA